MSYCYKCQDKAFDSFSRCFGGGQAVWLESPESRAGRGLLPPPWAGRSGSLWSEGKPRAEPGSEHDLLDHSNLTLLLLFHGAWRVRVHEMCHSYFWPWYLSAIIQSSSRPSATDLLPGAPFLIICSSKEKWKPHNWCLFPWSWEASSDSLAWISSQHTVKQTLLYLKMACSPIPQAQMLKHWRGKVGSMRKDTQKGLLTRVPGTWLISLGFQKLGFWMLWIGK